MTNMKTNMNNHNHKCMEIIKMDMEILKMVMKIMMKNYIRKYTFNI